MAEQVGSVFVEARTGCSIRRPSPNIVVRDPRRWRRRSPDSPIVQVVSLLPDRLPGHSLLTEDLGTVRHVDGAGAAHPGKGFVIHGRVPRAELRGCSDVIAEATAA